MFLFTIFITWNKWQIGLKLLQVCQLIYYKYSGLHKVLTLSSATVLLAKTILCVPLRNTLPWIGRVGLWKAFITFCNKMHMIRKIEYKDPHKYHSELRGFPFAPQSNLHCVRFSERNFYFIPLTQMKVSLLLKKKQNFWTPDTITRPPNSLWRLRSTSLASWRYRLAIGRSRGLRAILRANRS